MSVINLARPAPKPAKQPWIEDDARDKAAALDELADDVTPPEQQMEVASRSNANVPALREQQPHPGLFSFRERAALANIREQKEAIMEQMKLLQQGFARGQVAIRFEQNDGVVWGRLEVMTNYNGHLRAVPVATLTCED